jgi:hypothetical protein
MPKREKPEYTGEGQRHVPNWVLKNSFKEFDNEAFARRAKETRKDAIKNATAINERIVLNGRG